MGCSIVDVRAALLISVRCVATLPAPGWCHDGAVNGQPRRRLIADAMLWASRVLLVGVPLYAVWCRYALNGWEGVPQQDGAPVAWSFDVLMVAGLVLGGILPMVVLPMGSAVRTELRGGTLRMTTVLGPRTIDLDGARLRCWRIPGQGWGVTMTSVRQGWTWALVAESELWSRPGWLAELPRVAPNWLSWVKGWGLMVWAGLSAFIVGSLIFGMVSEVA